MNSSHSSHGKPTHIFWPAHSAPVASLRSSHGQLTQLQWPAHPAPVASSSNSLPGSSSSPSSFAP
ncbi:hypothetical protein PCANC_23684 [Puccinia coronata f. sp. avenae]|uniref:Uncharacterized protein n=1 Tax=Puccinia coronata f. sp. avenae TaxID=200324 RepID=A0A2N5UAN4_9BASI|nr:hypothetical protein PCANC_23684 [Puccinia coronata f. sp. avenae]